MASLRKTMTGEIKKALALSSDQSKRYDQIEIQAAGFQAFATPTVQEKLKLTDDQKSKIREIGEASRAHSRASTSRTPATTSAPRCGRR